MASDGASEMLLSPGPTQNDSHSDGEKHEPASVLPCSATSPLRWERNHISTEEYHRTSSPTDFGSQSSLCVTGSSSASLSASSSTSSSASSSAGSSGQCSPQQFHSADASPTPASASTSPDLAQLDMCLAGLHNPAELPVAAGTRKRKSDPDGSEVDAHAEVYRKRTHPHHPSLASLPDGVVTVATSTRLLRANVGRPINVAVLREIVLKHRKALDAEDGFDDEMEASMWSTENKTWNRPRSATETHCPAALRSRAIVAVSELLWNWELDTATFHLAVNLMDRMILEGFATTDAYTVLLVSVFVASKHEDIYPVSITTIAKFLDVPCSTVKDAERHMLVQLQWNMMVTLPLQWLHFLCARIAYQGYCTLLEALHSIEAQQREPTDEEYELLVNQCALLDQLDNDQVVGALASTLETYVTLYNTMDARPSQVAAAVLAEKIPALVELIGLASGYGLNTLDVFIPRIQCAAAAAQLVRGSKWKVQQNSSIHAGSTRPHTVQTPVSLPEFMLSLDRRVDIDTELNGVWAAASARNMTLTSACMQPLMQPHTRPPVQPDLELFLMAQAHPYSLIGT